MTQKIICNNCNSKNIIKKGLRKSKLQSKQIYQCKNCSKKFVLEQTKNKTYPIQTILKAISTYNLGHNLNQVQKMLEKTTKTKVPTSTISSWLNQHKPVCTFARLRNKAIKQFSPKEIIKKQTLSHIQPYTFKFHQAKLNLLIKENPQFSKLNDYIEKINSKEFPHHIFTYDKQNKNNQRASKIKFRHLKIIHIKKQNLANQLTALALNLATTNKDRHQAIQDFFLTNDSTTIAAELPVYLTNWDAGYYRNQRGFMFSSSVRGGTRTNDINNTVTNRSASGEDKIAKRSFATFLNNYQTPITGHADLIQIRNSMLHILDYKPNAHLNQEQTIQQLTIYALALSRKLNLELKHFKCGFFDENNYFEFFPLHAVYKKAG